MSEPLSAAVQALPLNCSDPKILEFIVAATAPNTRRAYQSDVRHFIASGGRIPATYEQVARYLADHAAVLSMATLTRRLVAIRSAHLRRGLADPTKTELVRLTFRGIRRTYSQPQRRVAALSTNSLRAIVASLGDSTRDIRDLAILLLGFGGAFRRSELVALDYNNLRIVDTGAVIVLRRTKTDQTNQGRTVLIPRASGLVCPIATLERWLTLSRIIEGAVFRRVSKGGKVQQSRISASAVARIVKERVLAIGGDPNRYSGHSLRAGFTTEAAKVGVPKWRIKAQTGHLSDSTFERYIRDAELSSPDIIKSIWTSFAGQLPGTFNEIETQ
jgi:integrase